MKYTRRSAAAFFVLLSMAKLSIGAEHGTDSDYLLRGDRQNNTSRLNEVERISTVRERRTQRVCIDNYVDMRIRVEQAQNGQAFEICCNANIYINQGSAITVRANNIFIGCGCKSEAEGECVLDRTGYEGRILHSMGIGITLRALTFQGAGSPGANGGAVYIFGGGTNTIVACIFRRNTAKNGGALYANSNGVTIIRNCWFEDNTATLSGGAGFLRNGNRNANIKTRGASNEAVQCNGIFYSDTAQCDSLRNAPAGCINNFGSLQRTLARGDETVRLCAHTRIYALQEIVILGSGRNIFCEGGGCIIDGSRNRGGRIFNIVGDNIRIVSVSFQNSVAPSKNGGAILVVGVNNQLVYCDFRNNVASNGGGIFVRRGAEVKILGSTFVNNQAYGRGGGAYVYFPTTEMFGDFANGGSSNVASQCPGFFNGYTNLCESMMVTTTDRGNAGNINEDLNRINDDQYDDFIPNDDLTNSILCIDNFFDLQNQLSIGVETMYLCSDTTMVITQELLVTGSHRRIICNGGEFCVLSRANGDDGRIFNVQGSNNEFIGISFRNAKNPEGNGGAMIISGEDNSIIDCDFSGNIAENGGGFYVERNLAVNLRGTSFQANQAILSGGAGYMNFQSMRIFSEAGNTGKGNTAAYCPDILNMAYGLCNKLS